MESSILLELVNNQPALNRNTIFKSLLITSKVSSVDYTKNWHSLTASKSSDTGNFLQATFNVNQSLDIVTAQSFITWHFCLLCRCVPTDVCTAETEGVLAAIISLHLPTLFCLHRLHLLDSCSKGTYHKSRCHCLPTAQPNVSQKPFPLHKD